MGLWTMEEQSSNDQRSSAACLGNEMSAGFIESVQGRLIQRVEKMEQIRQEVDGANVFIGIETTLFVIMEHRRARRTGTQAVAGIRISETVGGDYEIRVVGR